MHRRTFALIFFLPAVLLLAGPLVSPGITTVPVQEWVAHYDGPGEGHDRAEALVVDAAGNVYVTGSSEGIATGYDFATVKYDTNGNEMWVARYDGLANEDDLAYSLAVDPAGNVYVTGNGTESGTGTTGYDYVTVKYDPDGTELWAAGYNGPGNDLDVASSLGLDASGNAYVTGYSTGHGTDRDVATIKYDPDGTELWVARYNGPGNGPDMGRSLRMDVSGNVYVTGSSQGDGTDFDYVTIKYDSDGNQLWAARHNGPTDDPDYAQALTLDGAGYAYVTGFGAGEIGGANYVTVKYDPDGNELWVSRYAGPYSFDRAKSLTVDQDGNVYVTGDSSEPHPSGSGISEDYATVKYDEDGNEVWVERYDAPLDGKAFGYDVAVNQEGKVYVTGWVDLFPPVDNAGCRTIKYDTDGSVIGIATYDTWLKYEWGTALALDDAGNLYVVGNSSKESLGFKSDFLTIKYVECLDNDEDGYGDPTCGGDDCDDSNPGANPGEEEICDDAIGVDEDCDGLINEADPDCICDDNDSDGFGDPASSACTYPNRDCDDTNPDVYPGAPEIPNNGIDDDCDPSTPTWGTPASVVGDGTDTLRSSDPFNGILILFAPTAAVILLRIRFRKTVPSPIHEVRKEHENGRRCDAAACQGHAWLHR